MRNTICIGEVIRHAKVFNFKQHGTNAMSADSLLQSVEHLFTLLHERHTRYLLVGGIAMLQYVQGRNTEDIDLIMAVSALQALPEITVTEQDENFARGTFGALQIDFLLTSNPLFDLVQRQYATIQSFRERDIPCATVEGLILLKLYALPSLYRQGNFARVGLYENDIATLMHNYQPDLAPLFEELAHHVSASDVSSLYDIVAEIQRRITRFQQGL